MSSLPNEWCPVCSTHRAEPVRVQVQGWSLEACEVDRIRRAPPVRSRRDGPAALVGHAGRHRRGDPPDSTRHPVRIPHPPHPAARRTRQRAPASSLIPPGQATWPTARTGKSTRHRHPGELQSQRTAAAWGGFHSNRGRDNSTAVRIRRNLEGEIVDNPTSASDPTPTPDAAPRRRRWLRRSGIPLALITTAALVGLAQQSAPAQSSTTRATGHRTTPRPGWSAPARSAELRASPSATRRRASPRPALERSTSASSRTAGRRTSCPGR